MNWCDKLSRYSAKNHHIFLTFNKCGAENSVPRVLGIGLMFRVIKITRNGTWTICHQKVTFCPNNDQITAFEFFEDTV